MRKGYTKRGSVGKASRKERRKRQAEKAGRSNWCWIGRNWWR